MEEWVRLEEFPMYKISNFGNVMNDNSKKLVAKSLTKQGGVKVGLVSGGRQHTRSVAVLVAKIFVPGNDELFNTPIHLDADQRNCEANNLMWRPRWFAYKYHQQFTEMHQDRLETYASMGPVIDLDNRTLYATVLETAQTNGLLMYDIHMNAHKWSLGDKTHFNWPTHQRFGIGADVVFEK